MRVTFNMIHDGLDAINAAAEEFATAQRQVQTGKLMEVPSDNPGATEDAILQHSALGAIDSLVKSGNTVAAHQSTADSVMTDIVDKITAAITQVTAARGSEVPQSSRDAASQALAGIRDALAGDINTTLSGSSLFAGTAVNQTAYVKTGAGWVYQGDTAGATLRIDDNRSAALTWNGQAIFQGSATSNLLDTLESLVTAVSAGDATGMANGINDLQQAFSRATAAQTQLGADENSVQDAQSRLTTLRLATEARRSQDEDANIADAATKMAQAQTAYQAALAATGKLGQLSLLNYLQ